MIVMMVKLNLLKKFNDCIGCSVESSIYLTDSSPDEIKKTIICTNSAVPIRVQHWGV